MRENQEAKFDLIRVFDSAEERRSGGVGSVFG
jgi:hypothetical protein